jgi:prepilin-type processing-associated H-X9-DG protein
VDDILYLYFAPGAQEGALRSLLSPNPVNTDLLACVPPNAEQVVLTRLNLPLAYDTVIQVVKDVDPQAHEGLRQAMDKANQTLQLALEDDFFHALGDELVSYSLPLPIGELTTRLRARGMAGLTAWLLSVGRSSRSAVMLTVKDAARITKSMRALTDLMAEGLKPQIADVAWEEQTHAGVQVRVLRGVPQIAPAYAVTGRFLIIGGSLETLKSAVDQINTPGRSIRDSAMWAAVEARVPKGAGFISVGSATAGVEQLHLMFREFWLRPMVEHMQQIGQPDKLIAGVLQNDPAVFRDALKRNAFFSVTTIKAEPDGVAIRGHTLLGAGSVAVGAGPVLGGMLLPALIRSRGEARSASCANNLRQIGMAIAAYEMNHNGELPNTLEELVPLYIDDARVFQCPSAKDRPLAPGEKFRIDYDYLGHLPPGVAKPNTIIAYDKPGNHAGRRNCLYYDGHVGRVLEADLPRELQESLDGLKPWLDKQPEDVQKRVKAFCGAAD